MMMTIDLEAVKILRGALRELKNHRDLTDREHDALLHVNAKILVLSEEREAKA